MAPRLPIVGVMGSGSQPHAERARALGRWLAGADVHLLTGGGGGVMAAVSEAFASIRPRAGHVIGIVPGRRTSDGYRAAQGYPNPWVEIAIFTHLPLSGTQGMEDMSRNHVNVLSANVIVALPGGAGTASEVTLALRYGKPLIAFVDGPEAIAGLPRTARVEPDFERVKAFVKSCIDPGSVG